MSSIIPPVFETYSNDQLYVEGRNCHRMAKIGTRHLIGQETPTVKLIIWMVFLQQPMLPTHYVKWMLSHHLASVCLYNPSPLGTGLSQKCPGVVGLCKKSVTGWFDSPPLFQLSVTPFPPHHVYSFLFICCSLCLRWTGAVGEWRLCVLFCCISG